MTSKTARRRKRRSGGKSERAKAPRSGVKGARTGGQSLATSATGAGQSLATSATSRGRRISRRRLWLFRLAAVTVVPALFFLVAEFSLRVAGFGRPTGFLVPLRGRDGQTTNQQFGWRFFPPAIARTPVIRELAVGKDTDTYRVVVLGGSAAMGTPNQAFAFGRMLEVMLGRCLPSGKIEVINAAMTAINSHVVLPIARDCAELDPDLFVVYMGNNEVVGPYGSGTVFQGFSPRLSMIRASIFAKSTRLGQLLESAAGRIMTTDETPTEWRGMEMFLDHRVAADDPRMQKVYSHFRANLSDICDAGLDAGAKVIICTVATDLKDTAPFASLHRSDLDEPGRAQWQRFYAAGIALAEGGQYAEAVEQFGKAAAIDDRRADLHFRLARCLWALQQYEEAHKHFVQARDLDALRFRADSEINGIIRQCADDRRAQGVYLVDSERVFERSRDTLHETVGRELLYEHVHMRPEGNYLLAKAVFEATVPLMSEKIGVATRVSGCSPAVPEVCFSTIALTDWDRYRLTLDVSRMEQEPPFAGQLNHAERTRLHDEELEQLRAMSFSPAALQQAVGTYRTAIEHKANDVLLRQNYAALLFECGDLDEAAAQWRFLIGRFPDIAQWHIELGTVLKTQKKWAEAVTEYDEALRLGPELAPWVDFDIGTVRLEQGRLAEAEELFNRVLAVKPDMAQTHNSLGALQLKRERLDDAIERFRLAIRHDPKLAMAHHNCGYALAKQERLTEAVEEYRTALKLDPLHLDTYRDLGSLMVKQGKVPEALALYRQATQVAPHNAEAHYRLANTLAACGRATDAADAFGKVLELAPDHIEARHNLAVTLAILGDTAGAVEQYRQVLRQKPDYVATLNALGLILAAAEDPEFRDGSGAVRMMEYACRCTGGADAKCLSNLAAAYAETGRFDEAVATARKALQLAQSRGDAKLALSIQQRLLLFEAGKPYRRPTGRDRG